MNQLLIRTTLKKRPNYHSLRRDLLKLLKLLKLDNVELSLFIVGDRKMRGLNRSFRGIDRTTDVLSFPQPPFGQRPSGDSGFKVQGSRFRILGDIVINPQKVRRQASQNSIPFRKELRLILIHGLLHLLGYDHEQGETERLKMKKMEERLLNALEKLDRKRK